MPRVHVASFRQQGVNINAVPLDRSFGLKTEAEQKGIIMEIQLRANAAQLPGTVVPVWPNSSGGMNFIAPRPWHPFFKSISLRDVMANVNRELSW